MRQRNLFAILLLSVIPFMACRKSNDDAGGGTYELTYGTSVIYPQGGDQLVFPVNPVNVKGEFSSFPDGLELDEETGGIDVSDSESGLRYRVTFTPDNGGTASTTTVLIAGINYLDNFHFLGSNDTISRVMYNGSVNGAVPVSAGKTVFDVDLGCTNEGIAINRNDGTINLAQTIRNGFFGKHPDNDKREEFELEYMIDDNSKRKRQEIKIKLYYYNTINDVPADLRQLLKDREGSIIQEDGSAVPYNSTVSTAIAGLQADQGKARPRPPCIFIIGR